MRLFGLLLCVLCGVQSLAQDIPLGTWRTHFSYSSINSITETPNTIFAAADVGLFTIDKNSSDIQRFSALDGFQDVEANVVHYDVLSGTLLIGYASGNLDLIRNGEIIQIDLVSDSQVIGSKAINDILSVDAFAYLATDYGVLKFDIARAEVRETYREIGAEATQLGVNDLAILGDSIFVATPDGIQAGDITQDNLVDFRAWRRYSTFDREVDEVETAHGRVYTIYNDLLYSYEDIWEPFIPSTSSRPERLSASQENLILLSNKAEVMNANGDIVQEASGDEISELSDALIDTNNRFWVGDLGSGLWLQQGTALVFSSPSGPIRAVPFAMGYAGVSILALPGGYSSNVIPQGNDFGYTTFTRGTWDNLTISQPFLDVVDGAEWNDALYLASAGDGLYNSATGELFDETNSPLEANSNGVIVPAIASTSRGLYLVNYGANRPLHRLDAEGNWETYDLAPEASSATGLEAASSLAWMILPSNGIYAYDIQSGDGRHITDEVDDGGLASNNVGDVVLDKEGFLWIGTSRGVSVWFTPFRLSGAINATEPVFEGRPLLVDQRVNAIAVDGGNRKWIGTDAGAWLFDPFAEALLLNFTEDNSPLPSNDVLDIAIDEATGEVFFLTEAGMVSYRSDATESDGSHSGVKIFPNPVEPTFQGEVGIRGLATNASIKITDSGGRLVYETIANGGTATWPVRSFPGGSLRSGIYYIFSVAGDGAETYVGKVAVIE